MHGYPEFLEDVRNAFSNLINKKKPISNSKSDVDLNIYAVELSFEDSKLTLDLDRMDLQSNFVNPLNNKKYNILKIAEILYPTINFGFKSDSIPGSRVFLLESLKYTDGIVEEYLMDVVDGNFTWSNVYLENDELEAQMIQEVLNLDPEDLISQKFWNGDKTWKIDLKLKKNN